MRRQGCFSAERKSEAYGQCLAHLDEVVRPTAEETLNALLDAEEHARRKLQSKAGAVTLTMPKPCTLPFETAIIDRYRPRESPVEEALIEVQLAGASVRRVQCITQAR